MHTSGLVEELGKLEFFRDVEVDIVSGAAGCSKVRKLGREEILLAPGHLNRHLYLVLSGSLRVQLSLEDNDPVAIVGKGETVGEMSIIDHDGCAVYVIADEDSRLLEMEEDMLWSLVQVSPAAAKNLLGLLTRRLRHANSIIAEKVKNESPDTYGTMDPLTGLHNRRWVNGMLPRHISRCVMGGHCLSALLIDIDNFENFNEKYGRFSGDRALYTLGRILLDYIRPTEMAARYSGDRFLVLLPDVDGKKAEVVAERLRQKVANAVIVMPDGHILPSLTISIGVASAGQDHSAEEFLLSAETSLEQAKAKGGNCVVR